MDALLEKLEKYIHSEEGKANSIEIINRINEENLIYDNKIQAIHDEISLLSDTQFDELLNIEFINNGDEWNKECYNNNISYHPKERLQLIIDTMFKYGIDNDEIKNEKNNDRMFYIDGVDYKNYHIEQFGGQGEIITRFYKNNDLIFQI